MVPYVGHVCPRLSVSQVMCVPGHVCLRLCVSQVMCVSGYVCPRLCVSQVMCPRSGRVYQVMSVPDPWYSTHTCIMSVPYLGHACTIPRSCVYQTIL